MGQVVGDWVFEPNLEAYIEEAQKRALLNTSDRVGEQAINVVMDAWLEESGFTFAGQRVKWIRSPTSTRENDILDDTGLLKSTLGYRTLSKSPYLELTIEKESYPDRPDIDTEFVSSIHQDSFPHLGIPEEYIMRSGSVGSEVLRIYREEFKDAFFQLMDEGKLYEKE
jgi:hypothetical protein